MPVSSWSTTASSNATADAASGINWAEGMAPGQINDSARAMMAVIKGDFDKSHAANGYQKFPNGLIIQWGTRATPDGSNQAIAFPIAFPTACLGFLSTVAYAAGQTRLVVAFPTTPANASSVNLSYRYADNGGGVNVIAATASWFAWGY